MVDVMAHVKLDRISKSFKGHTALHDLSIEIADGQFFVLLGPTGAGKTTTLRLIAGLEKPDQGLISIDGHDVSALGAAERDVALVLQQYSLYPRYTVRENLEFPLKSRIRRMNADEINERVMRAAKVVRVDHLLDRKTDRLSGGEMQRVSIGRAIVRQPKIFLMDEPLSNLDAKLREALRAELKDLKSRLGATFLFVTHDQVEAMSMGDKIAVLNEGQIIQIGTPYEIYNKPNSVFVAGFVGSPAMNLLKATYTSDRITIGNNAFSVALSAEQRVGLANHSGEITFGFRAENVALSTQGSEAFVHDVENHGVEKVVTLKSGDQLFRVTTPANVPLHIEQKVHFEIDLSKIHIFDGATGKRIG